MMRREYDPSREIRVITQPGSPMLFNQRVPMAYTNLPVPPQTPMLPGPMSPIITVPMGSQPPRVMSHIRNTGVFAGLSGCGCGGKGG